MIAQILMDVQPIEIDGRWWVEISMNSRKLKKRGPFSTAVAAQTEADRVVRYWQPALPATTNATVVLHGKPVALDSDLGRRFVTDACRSGEGDKGITDATLREIYGITNDKDWTDIAANVALGRAVRDERKRRIRNGQAAREAACELYAQAPAAMGTIMNSEKSPMRARIEAAREIRTQAIGGDSAENTTRASEMFSIVFNLGADVEKIEKVIEHKTKQIESEIDADNEQRQ